MKSDGGNSSEKDTDDNYLRVFTVVVMGDSRVGKSALVGRFLGREFEEKHEPTVENFHVKHISYKDKSFELQIIDTSGTYEFPAMRRLDISKADGIVLVYSLDQEKSFDRMERYMTEVRELRKGNSVPMVIVSNKSDIPSLEEQQIRDESGFFVSTTYYLEKKWGCPCVDASAKLNDNVGEVFLKLLRNLSSCRKSERKPAKLSRRRLSASLLHPLQRLRVSKSQ